MKFILTTYSNFSFTEIQAGFSVLFCTLPVIVYSNAETDKSTILSDNKGKAGIYQWKHKESGKIYIGSAFDLYKRFTLYFSKPYLTRFRKSYIYRALLLHGYSAFSLSIVEYIDISHLSKEDARLFIIKREQHFLDQIFSVDEPNTYNLLKVAGSLLGFKHDEESLAKRSGESNHMFGKSHTEKSKLLMSEGQKKIDRTGENNPMFGIAKSGEDNPASKKVFVYSSCTPTILSHEFVSYSEAGKHFSCHRSTIARHLKSGKVFQGNWLLSSTKK
jgi:group I intron endonuclease